MPVRVGARGSLGSTGLATAAMVLALAVACGPAGSGPAIQEVPEDAGPDGALLFENGRVIVGDGTVLDDAAFLVEDGRFRQFGSRSEVLAPPGAVRIDLSGRTVIPALIDAHAHLGYEGYTGWGADEYSLANLVEHLERYAYYGFGAVFSAGTDPDDLALEIERAQLSGEIGGARFVFAAGMGPPGQGPNDRFVGHTLTVAEETDMIVLRGAASGDEGRAAVRAVADKGIPFVKIWVDDRGGSQTKLAPSIYRAIVDEAKRNGIKVVVHQQTADEIPDLLDAGVDGFLHGRIGPALDARIAEQLAESGAFLVPNLGLGELRRERVGDDPFLQETAPAGVTERLQRAYDEVLADRGAEDASQAQRRERELAEGFARLLDAGVDIVLGTDAGAAPDHFFGYTGHRELEIFVRLGMTPAEALVAATSRAAEHLGLSEQGRIASGLRADFVVLESDPLDDIRNTRTISSVYLEGRELDRSALRERWVSGG